MTMLYLGLVLFLAIHILPTLGGLRGQLVRRVGENGWKSIHSLITVGAIVLMVLGWRQGSLEVVYAPPAWGRNAAFVLMLPVLYLLIGRRIGTNLKRHTAHPMLWAVALWAGAHLLANGELRAAVLFGGLGGYALFAMWWQNARGVAKTATQTWPWSSEFRALAVTLAVYAALVAVHRWVAGVALVG